MLLRVLREKESLRNQGSRHWQVGSLKDQVAFLQITIGYFLVKVTWPQLSWFDMWFNILVVKPRFLIKIVDLWSLKFRLLFRIFLANSVKRRQTHLDLERIQVAYN